MQDSYLEKSKRYKGYHYSVLTQGEFEYLHNTTRDMMSIIVSILKKHDIRYAVCGGTLLGAYTTGKFIPWDDDVDICVLEDDFDKMEKCIQDNIPDWMELQNNITEPNYYHGWVKIRDKRSIVYPMEKKYHNNGVWIDIYRLKKISKNKIDYMINAEHLAYLIRRRKVGGITFRQFLKKIFDSNIINKALKSYFFSLSTGKDDMKYVIWSASKIVLDLEWAFPTKPYVFEDIEVQSFGRADLYLEQHYGPGYKTFPPDEYRRIGIEHVEYEVMDSSD